MEKAPSTAQTFKMIAAANLYFDGVPGGGAHLVAALRAVGATRIGSTDIVRAPLEVADSDVLDYADEIVVTADDWTAIVVIGDVWSLSVRTDRAAIVNVTTILAQLISLGAVDFAVAHVAPPTGVTLRDELVLRTSATDYRTFGMSGVGISTYLSKRILALVDPSRREDLVRAGSWHGPLLHFAASDAAARSALERKLLAAGVVCDVTRGEVRRAPRWVSPAPTEGPRTYAPAAAHAIEELQATNQQDETVADVHCSNLVAPFARLASIKAEGLDFENGKLPFAELAGSFINDAQLGGSDLRGVDARGCQWIDVSLVEADLRWASFSNARLSLSRLDHANCAHIDLDGAAELDSASNACFDAATAVGWDAREVDFTSATFRNAILRGVNFAHATLVHADLREADLTDANLRNADLRGADLTGARLDGADLTGAKTEGARLPGT